MISTNSFIDYFERAQKEKELIKGQAFHLERYIKDAGLNMWCTMPHTGFIGLDITPFVEANFEKSTTFSDILRTIERLFPYIFTDKENEMRVTWEQKGKNDIRFYLFMYGRKAEE